MRETTVARERAIDGVEVPTFLYGTAWKEDRTERLTAQALAVGFRGIDTANQPRHYHERGVGRALEGAFEASTPRESLFVQSKFTYPHGQDHRLPYDPQADPATQVRQSFESSLEHLGTDYLDSFVLHGPSTRIGLTRTDVTVWQAMEALHDEGRVRLLGVSNVLAEQVTELMTLARVRPRFVQNRCFAATGWDGEVRAICARHDIVYQGFSLLTANRHVWAGAPLAAIADRLGRTPAQVIFRFALQQGMIPLTGSGDPEHLAQDLDVYALDLSAADVQTIASAGLRARR